MKKVAIDSNLCIGCGACTFINSIFEMGEESAVVVCDLVPNELVEEVDDAIVGCPTSAISWQEDEEV